MVVTLEVVWKEFVFNKDLTEKADSNSLCPRPFGIMETVAFNRSLPCVKGGATCGGGGIGGLPNQATVNPVGAGLPPPKKRFNYQKNNRPATNSTVHGSSSNRQNVTLTIAADKTAKKRKLPSKYCEIPRARAAFAVRLP